MATIRDLLDGKELNFAASPLAKHVSSHLQDPVGATKDQFGKLQKARLNYDMAREETQRDLAPVQSLITHLSQMHGLDPGKPTPSMGQGVDSMGGPEDELDENGNPTPKPGMTPGVGLGNTPNPENDRFGNPNNMQQTVGKMNQTRPSLAGHQPGVAPMMEKQVVPPKLGMASPGAPKARNSPAPNPHVQYNPAAKPPKGNRSLPGAKGPGDAKVENRTKKAFGKTSGTKNELSRPIKVTVHAAASTPRVTTIEDCRSLADLKFHGRIEAGSMPIGPGGALGPSGVMPKSNPATGEDIKAMITPGMPTASPVRPTGGFRPTGGMPSGGIRPGGGGSVSPMRPVGMRFKKSKEMDALDELSDKEPDNTEHQVAFNPVIRSKGHGTSHGARKGWSTRGKGHLSTREKSAHYKTLDACAKCGGIHAKGMCPKDMDARDFSTGERKKLAKTGAAMPGGGYPIKNRQDLANAKQAIGRAKNRSATIAHINKRAKVLGAPGFGK